MIFAKNIYLIGSEINLVGSKNVLEKSHKVLKNLISVNHFISSFVASLLAAIASCPIDVVRTRLMNQRKIFRSYGSTSVAAQSTVYFANSFECLTSILRNEGFMALYKGKTV